MNLTYEKKEGMTFIGYHTEIKPDEGYIKCPEFWEKEFNEKYARLWQTMKPETPIEEAIVTNGIGMFAICTESENCFEYWIAGLYRGQSGHTASEGTSFRHCHQCRQHERLL